MKINEVRKLTGLTAKTIRFYEEKGLITPTSDERDGKRWRDYSESDVTLLRTVSELRRALFPIGDIQAMFSDPASMREIVSRHGKALRKSYEHLGVLLEAFESPEVECAQDVFELAGALHSATTELPLPEIDMNPHFRHLDELEAGLTPAPRRRVKVKLFTKGYIIFAAVLAVIVALSPLAALLLKVESMRLVVVPTAAVCGIILMLVTGGKLIIPIFSGSSSGGDRMLEMATLQGIGGIQAGERSTAFGQVQASPLAKGYLIKNDIDGERDKDTRPSDPRLD